ncbi:MAG TPA: DNA primase [Clostridiales bacterium]|nr:DNA primase [Clostridiales bacterium]HPP68780.1 DNA primase [Clostridiales bacterium]HQA05627.1 DNA primase [Clostridiales bacterium]
MARFSDDFLFELRSRIDIEELISSYVRLKKQGRISRGLCPFHVEKTPSFTVYSDTQSYYCFGCGAGGESITFIRNIENLSYYDAVQFLAEKVGLKMPEETADDGLYALRKRIFEANREAARFFYANLIKPDCPAYTYLIGRGIKPETIKRFGLGYAPDSWDALTRHLRSKGFKENELISADLSQKSRTGGLIDVFRNRLMFPIIDLKGNVIAFGGRVLGDEKPKYINTSDTPVYKKGKGIFALNIAKAHGRSLILCEGYMDVIAMHQAGFQNAVAGLGTAFTSEQAQILSRYADEVILAYDSDDAGKKAAKRTMSIFQSMNVKTKILTLTGGKDPDEIIKRFGREYMQKIIDGSLSSTEYKLALAKEGINTDTADGKVEYLKKAVEVLSELDDAIERDVYAGRLSEETGVTRTAIDEQIKRALSFRKRKQDIDSFNKAREILEGKVIAAKNALKLYNQSASLRCRQAEETLLASLIQNPEFYKKLKDKITIDDFSSALHKRLFFKITERIENNQELDLIYFADEFNPEEMSILTKVFQKGRTISNTLDECLDCIKVMSEEKLKQSAADPSKLSDEEFLRLFYKKE